MAVVWGTIKDHNGYIDVKSTEGVGTTFTLYFPAIREKLAADKILLSIEGYAGKGESILIVDDVEEQREIACYAGKVGLFRKVCVKRRRGGGIYEE